MKKILLSVIIVLSQCLVFAQNFQLSGNITDKQSNLPLCNAYIYLSDSNNVMLNTYTASDSSGFFSLTIPNSEHNFYAIIHLLAYEKKKIFIGKITKDNNLGTIYLEKDSKNIEEINITGNNVSAILKGDTTEINVSAFKTTADANTEDLLTKLPGINVNNGIITSNGEEITKITLDGKDFYGDDPSVAIKNLPADLVDKIQIFDRLTEMEQYVDFSETNSGKTLNIVSKPSKLKGQFGRFFAGTDFNDKYLLGGNYNKFKKKFRFSIIGLANNINQLNISEQDRIAINSVTKEKTTGGFTMNKQNGLNTTNSIGLNINKEWDKLDIAGSYFLNSNDNNSDLFSQKRKFLFPLIDHFTTLADSTEKQKYTHRANLRLEYRPSKKTSIVNTAKLTIQNQNSDEIYYKKTYEDSLFGRFVSLLNLKLQTEEKANSFENEMVINHKFNKKKRSFTLEINYLKSYRKPSDGQTGIWKKKEFGADRNANQLVNGETKNQKTSFNAIYTEPLGKGALHFNIKSAYSDNYRNRQLFSEEIYSNNFQIIGNQTTNDSTYSNIFSSYYLNNQAGILYRIKNEKFKLSFGTRYQLAFHDANQSFPNTLKVNNKFENILPEFQLTLKYPIANFKIDYETSVNTPSINQLSNQPDRSDQSNISAGNPFLKQEYIHDLSLTYTFANPANSLNFAFYLSGRYIHNYIGSQTLKPSSDSIIDGLNVQIDKGVDFSRPINFDNYKRFRSMFSIGLPLLPISCKLNLSTGYNYSQTPRFINNTEIIYNWNSILNSISVASSISQNIDFLLSYSISLNKIKYSNTQVETLTNGTENWFTEHIFTAKFNWIFWKGFKIAGDIFYLKDVDFYTYNPEYLLCNFSLAKNIFKNQAGEIKVGVSDVFEQNQSVVHVVSPQYILDSKVNTLSRYFMLTFTFNLGSAQNYQQNKEKKNK